MDETRALTILSALANGVNPLTGEVFAADSPYQSADVIRAMYVAVRSLELTARRRTRPRGDVPANAGKPWADDEDRRLLAEFDGGRSVAELAQVHARTQAGIQARLERHGRIPAATVNRPSLYRRADGDARAAGRAARSGS